MSAEPGSVPDLWQRARGFRRRSWVAVALAVLVIAEIGAQTMISAGWASVASTMLLALVVFAQGATWQICRSRSMELASQAWTMETAITIAGMAQSGVFTPIEAMEAVRDGPPPPFFSRRQWRDARAGLVDGFTAGLDTGEPS